MSLLQFDCKRGGSHNDVVQSVGGAIGSDVRVTVDTAYTRKAALLAIDAVKQVITRMEWPGVTTDSILAPALTLSRNSGIAPLGVVFSGKGTTDLNATDVFDQCAFSWNFGDGSAGSTSNGAKLTSKNMAYGPTAVHVYENPGVYFGWQKVISADGATSRTTPFVVTVLDPEVMFNAPFGQTVCFSNNTDFTGAPTGATHVSGITTLAAAAGYVANNTRLMLHGTHTFADDTTLSSLNLSNHSVVTVTSFGTGKATLGNSHAANSVGSCVVQVGAGIGNAAHDIRIHNVHLAGDPANVALRGIQCFDENVTPDIATKGFYTVHDVTADTMGICAGMAGYGSVLSTCTLDGTIGTVGTVVVFALTNGMRHFGMIDVYADRHNVGEHCVRLHGLIESAISNVTVKNVPAGRHLMTLRDMPGVAAGMANDWNTVTNIDFDARGSQGGASHLQIAPTNSTSYGPNSNFLVDHCLFRPYDWTGATTFTDMPAGIIEADQVTFRHNAIDVSSYDNAGAGAGISSGIQLQNANIATPTPQPACDTIRAYNNTMVGFTKIKTSFIVAGSNVTNVSSRDNLLFVPKSFKDGTGNDTHGNMIANPVPAGVTIDSHNSSDLQMSGLGTPANAVDPQFVVAQPVEFGDFELKPGTGSYALTGSTKGGRLGLNTDLAAV